MCVGVWVFVGSSEFELELSGMHHPLPPHMTYTLARYREIVMRARVYGIQFFEIFSRRTMENVLQ